ncbi:MAG: hypothetical protein ACJ782_08055, partial [Actinomycetota bacterium]
PTALAVAGGATAGPVGVLGGCVLDLRAASFTAPVTTITAVTVLSGVDVLVPPGVRVVLSVYGLFRSADSLLPEQHLPPDTPLVRARCFCPLGWRGGQAQAATGHAGDRPTTLAVVPS